MSMEINTNEPVSEEVIQTYSPELDNAKEIDLTDASTKEKTNKTTKSIAQKVLSGIKTTANHVTKPIKKAFNATKEGYNNIHSRIKRVIKKVLG